MKRRFLSLLLALLMVFSVWLAYFLCREEKRGSEEEDPDKSEVQDPDAG